MVPFSFRQLEYLIACVDEGSVAAAARRLNVTQPSISTAIAKLEAGFGVQLLLRQHAQGVLASPAAERLLPSIRRLLGDAESLNQAARTASEAIAGDLRLGGFSPLAATYLPGLIATLRDVHPDVSLTLEEGSQEALIDGLRAGRHEFALLYDLDMPDGLRKIRLAELRPHVLLSASHRLSKRRRIALRELESESFILLDVAPSRAYFTAILDAAGVAMPIAHASPSLEVVRGLVGRGLGFSILVTRPPGDLTYDGMGLAVIPIAEPVAPSPVVLAALAGLKPTKVMEAFIALARGYFTEVEAPPK